MVNVHDLFRTVMGHVREEAHDNNCVSTIYDHEPAFNTLCIMNNDYNIDFKQCYIDSVSFGIVSLLFH